MALPPGAELLGVAASLVVLYLLISIGYRRFLFQWLPDPPERSPEADQPVGPDELRCPQCGAINDAGFARCYECSGRLPTEPIGDDADDRPA